MTGSGNGKIHIWEIDDNEDDENDNDGNAYHDSKDIAGKD